MLEIKSGTPADVEASSTFLQAAGLRPDLITPPNVDILDTLFAVATCCGRVVGLARGGQAREASGNGVALPGLFHINTVIVEPEFRGAGVGRGLVERLLLDARLSGFSAAQLWVHTANTAALSVYEMFGFAPEGSAVEHQSGA